MDGWESREESKAIANDEEEENDGVKRGENRANDDHDDSELIRRPYYRNRSVH